jgi:hypothetical protein
MGYIAKDDIAFFDAMATALEAREAEKPDKVLEAKLNKSIQAFLQKPKKMYEKQIQAVGVSTDFAILTKESFNVTIQTDNFDMGWEQAFKSVPLGKNQDSWEIYDVANSLTFYKVEEGQRLECASMTGTKATAYTDYYGGAIGWTDKLIRFRKIPAMMDMASIFRNKFWANKAANHYSLLATAAAINTVAYQGAAGDGQLRRDVQTLNLAAYQLGNTLKNKGYGDMANAAFIIYANPFDEDRIEAAFRATTADIVGGGLNIGQQLTRRRIKRIYTYNTSITAGNPIMVKPGQKLQRAEAMSPTVYTQEVDVLTLNRVQAVWAIYGAVIGDTDQCLNIELS